MKASPSWRRRYAKRRGTWETTAGAAVVQQRSRSVSSEVLPCCTLCCNKWHHVAARTAGPRGRYGKWRSRSRPRSRASADPRATFGPGQRRSVRRSCRSTRRRRRRSSANSTAGPLSSRIAGRRAASRQKRRGCVNLWDMRKRRRIAAAVPAEMVHLDERESRYKSNEYMLQRSYAIFDSAWKRRERTTREEWDRFIDLG